MDNIINTQQIIIITLCIIAVTATIKDYVGIVEIIVAGLIGALSLKRATETTEKQEDGGTDDDNETE